MSYTSKMAFMTHMTSYVYDIYVIFMYVKKLPQKSAVGSVLCRTRYMLGHKPIASKILRWGKTVHMFRCMAPFNNTKKIWINTKENLDNRVF